MRNSQQEILLFWFEEIDPSLWSLKNKNFNLQIKERFEITYKIASEGLCDSWQDTPDGTLALAFILGQFPRRLYSDTAEKFSADNKALLI